MLPFGTVKLTSRSTTWSSNANDTWSSTTAGDEGVFRAAPSCCRELSYPTSTFILRSHAPRRRLSK